MVGVGKAFTNATEKNTVISGNEAPSFVFDIGNMSSGSNLNSSGQGGAAGGAGLNNNSGIKIDMLDGGVIEKAFDFAKSSYGGAQANAAKALDAMSETLKTVKSADGGEQKDIVKWIVLAVVAVAIVFVWRRSNA